MANEFKIKNGAISPSMVITDTNVSTSTTSGALQVGGGAGIVGNVYANAFYGSAIGLTSIPGGNVTGSVPSATVAATVTTGAQPNITSVGTLTGLTSSGVIHASNTIMSSLSSGANAVANNALFINGTNSIRIIGNVPSLAWNDITQQNDMVILYSTDVKDTGALCITTWSSTPSGIRFTPGNNAISGNVTVATNGTLSVANTLASTSTTTGSLKTSGGLGVAGNIWSSAVYCSGATSGYASIIGNSSQLTLGRIDNVASTPQIDFNCGATTVDYDVRISCSGGNGTNGRGVLTVACNGLESSGKIGYSNAYGIGSSVTQLTSRTTGVTINALTGRITLVSATTTAGQISTFTVTNSFMTASDIVYFTQVSGSGYYIITPKSTAAGSFSVNVYTPTAVSSAESPAFNFAIIRGSLT